MLKPTRRRILSGTNYRLFALLLFFIVGGARMLVAAEQITENDLFGEWVRSGELGYSVSMKLSADHSYTAEWFGCAVGPNGPIPYGSARGTWKLDGNRLVIAPEKESEDVRGNLETLELRMTEAKPTLWPTRYPRLPREFGFTRVIVFERLADVEAKQKAEDEVPRIIPEEDRGPTTRECTMDTWSADGKVAKLPAPKAPFTIPAGWGVSPGFEDWPAERDTWWIMPLERANERPEPKIDIQIELTRLRDKDARTQHGRAQWYRDIFKDNKEVGQMRLLGVVKTVATKQFGQVNVYHFQSEHRGQDWIVYLFGKRSVAEVHLWDHDGKSDGEKYLSALEAVTKSVSLAEN